MTGHSDDVGADQTRSFEPPDPSRPVLPAPTVSRSELPPPILSSRQFGAGAAPPAPDHVPAVPADEITALPTDEVDVVGDDAVPIHRTTILKGPGSTGIGPGDRRLVRGSELAPKSGDVLASTPSTSSLPDRTMPSGELSSLVLGERSDPPSPGTPPPPPPGTSPSGVGRPTPASTPPGQLVSGRQPVVRPITVPPRREQSFAARAADGRPFPAHAPPVRIRRARRRSSGIGLILTLIVMGGVIAAAVVYGRPILFPDEWSGEARPYGEAVEASLGIDMDQRPDISRVPTDVHRRGMLDRFGGEWQDDLPLWRSLGLASSDIDPDVLAGLLADWQPAYFDADGQAVVVDEAATDVEAHLTTAMAVGALDQRLDWNSRRDDGGLELRVLIDAQVRALARAASSATTFGAADDARPLSAATFLPPVLAYRIHGPLAFGELVSGDVAAPEAIAAMSMVGEAPSARLADGDVFESLHVTDRAFWYLVFAGRVDARRAYDASNGLSLATLTTARQDDAICAYATFSGADPDRTAALSSVLDDWAASAPAEMSASTTVRTDGVLQLRSCDPGAGFENDGRFGVARELVRWRLVELAVRERATELGADADAAVATVRLGTAAEVLLQGGFEVSPEAERTAARQIAEDVLGR